MAKQRRVSALLGFLELLDQKAAFFVVGKSCEQIALRVPGRGPLIARQATCKAP
jgi:hypothetical protein